MQIPRLCSLDVYCMYASYCLLIFHICNLVGKKSNQLILYAHVAMAKQALPRQLLYCT